MEKYNAKKHEKLAKSGTIEGIKSLIRKFYFWDEGQDFDICQDTGKIKTPEGKTLETIVAKITRKGDVYGFMFCYG